MYPGRDLNPHVRWTLDPEPSASANFATRADIQKTILTFLQPVDG